MTAEKMTALGDLVDITHGYPFDGAFFAPNPTGRVLLTPANFYAGGGFKGEKLKYYNGNGPLPEGYRLEPGQLVLPLTDLSPGSPILGCAARVPDMPGTHFLQNQRIGKVVPLNRKARTNYLHWLMRSPAYRRYVRSRAVGSTVRHAGTRWIKAYRFLLPSQEQQKERAGLLDRLERRMENFRRTGGVLECIINKMFREHFPQARDFYRSGETYPPVPLGGLGKIVCGKTPSRGNRDFFGGPVPFVKVPDMRRGIFITRTADSLTRAGAASQRGKEIHPGSLCVSCTGTIGLTALTSETCFTNQQVNTLVPHDRRHAYYLYCLLSGSGPLLAVQSEGSSAAPYINTRAFAAIEVPDPLEEVLESFYRAVFPLFQRCLLFSEKTRGLELLRDRLLLWNFPPVPGSDHGSSRQRP